MFQINILNLLEWRLYHENVVGYESSGYETSMGTKRLDTHRRSSMISFCLWPFPKFCSFYRLVENKRLYKLTLEKFLDLKSIAGRTFNSLLQRVNPLAAMLKTRLTQQSIVYRLTPLCRVGVGHVCNEIQKFVWIRTVIENVLILSKDARFYYIWRRIKGPMNIHAISYK